MPRNFLADFYAGYERFNYQPRESVNKQFNRLCRFKGWVREDDEQKEAYEEFRDALVQQFNSYYGTDENNLGLWQALCRRIGIPPPETLEAARNAVLLTHVNICDLIQSYGTDDVVTRKNAYAGGLLKYLLREIHGSYLGGRKPETGQRGGRRGGGRRK